MQLDKEYQFKVTRDLGFLIEGTITIWAKTKLIAKGLFKGKWSKYTIVSIKKMK